MERYKVDNNFIEYEQVYVDSIFNIPIVDKSGNVLARAILTQNVRQDTPGKFSEVVILTDIIVYDPNDRGKGLGDKIMGFITSCGRFEKIVTGISTKAGRELCLKWGFKYDFIKEKKFLIWEKKNDT